MRVNNSQIKRANRYSTSVTVWITSNPVTVASTDWPTNTLQTVLIVLSIYMFFTFFVRLRFLTLWIRSLNSFTISLVSNNEWLLCGGSLANSLHGKAKRCRCCHILIVYLWRMVFPYNLLSFLHTTHTFSLISWLQIPWSSALPASLFLTSFLFFSLGS